MSKNTDALKRAEKERHLRRHDSGAISQKREISYYGIIGKKGLKNSLLIWVFSGAVLITVLLAFNRQGSQKIPLSEIFPEQEVFPVDVEYEFVEPQVVDQVEPKATEVIENKQVSVAAVESKEVENKVVENKVVENKAQEVASKDPAPEVVKPVGSLYAIQVSSFKTSAGAKQDVDKLIKKGYEAYSMPKDLGSQGTWYRVYIGRFSTQSSAVALLEEVKKEFKDSFIRKIQ